VFLGFEPDDPDLMLLLRGLLGGAASGAQHFLLWAGAPRSMTNGAVDVLTAELDVTVIPCAGNIDDVAHALVDAWRPIADEAPAPRRGHRGLADRGRPRSLRRRCARRPRSHRGQLRVPDGDRAALASLLIGRGQRAAEEAAALRLEAARHPGRPAAARARPPGSGGRR
jgi:hypothetical protein